MTARLIWALLLVAVANAEQPAAVKDWELVRSVRNGFGGTLDLVLISDAKQRDREYYRRVADSICESRTTCMVNFWTDRKHIPEGDDGWISVKDLAVMTASYERSPTYKEPSLHLACWLYPSKKLGEADKCAYFPAAKRPPDS